MTKDDAIIAILASPVAKELWVNVVPSVGAGETHCGMLMAREKAFVQTIDRVADMIAARSEPDQSSSIIDELEKIRLCLAEIADAAYRAHPKD